MDRGSSISGGDSFLAYQLSVSASVNRGPARIKLSYLRASRHQELGSEKPGGNLPIKKHGYSPSSFATSSVLSSQPPALSLQVFPPPLLCSAVSLQ